MDDTFGKGILDRPTDPSDPRDYRHEEIAAFAPVEWMEKRAAEFLTYPKHNQNGSSSCVANTKAKQLEVDELGENGVYRQLSPRSIYGYGFIPDTGGMYIRKAADIITSQGATLGSILSSEGLSEGDMRNLSDYHKDGQQIAKIYKCDSVVFCNKDFDTIASVLENFRSAGKPKAVGIAVPGWKNQTWQGTNPMPGVGAPDWYHAVTVIDYGLMGGKKFLSIDNSWGESVGLAGQQFLGEEYEPLIYSADYTLNLSDDWMSSMATIIKPSYQWNTDLAVGDSGTDVQVLQKALQSLGMFPIDSVVTPTGYFGGITRQAVLTFQSVYGITSTGIVGPVTRAKLNTLFP